MSVEENKATVRRIIEEIWNIGNSSLVAELFSVEYIFHSPAGDELRGPEGFERRMKLLKRAFPDVHMEIEDIFGEGDKVAYRIKTKGTFFGKLGDIEPNGKSFQTRASIFSRFQNGKVIEDFEYMTEPSFIQQIGIVWKPGRK